MAKVPGAAATAASTAPWTRRSVSISSAPTACCSETVTASTTDGSAGSVTAQHGRLAVGTQAQLGRFDTQSPELAHDLPGQPVLGRQPAGRGRVDGIAHADGLVVAELTEVRFAVEQRTQVKVADHSQGGRVRRPFGSVTERGIVVADESVDVRFGQASAGDAAGHEDHRPVHGDLHAHQGPWLTLGREVDDGIRDPVTDLVGMTGADGLCRSASRSSGDGGHDEVHQFTSRVSWRPVKGLRSRIVELHPV